MDTSEQYIKMCEKAEEIQARVLLLGICEPEYLHTCGADVSSEGDWFHQHIWLPRQDQLQEMVNELPEWQKHIINRLYAFADFVHKEPYLPKHFKDIEKDEACHFFTSMEQLWLAFVMKEKYNKIWYGEDWK